MIAEMVYLSHPKNTNPGFKYHRYEEKRNATHLSFQAFNAE